MVVERRWSSGVGSTDVEVDVSTMRVPGHTGSRSALSCLVVRSVCVCECVRTEKQGFALIISAKMQPSDQRSTSGP